MTKDKRYTKRPEDCDCYVEGDTSCRCCGASLIMPVHALTRGLVEVLVILAYHAKKQGGYTVDISDIDLNYTQRSTLQKLRYFGLLVKNLDKDGKHKLKSWIITTRGWEFLSRETLVVKHSRTFHNRIVHWTEEEAREIDMVSIDDILGDKDAPYWQNVEDFKNWREFASPQLGLL